MGDMDQDDKKQNDASVDEPDAQDFAQPSPEEVTRTAPSVSSGSEAGSADLPVAACQSAVSLMPQDIGTRIILEERARIIAKPAAQQQHQLRSQYLCFRLGQVERYGIAYPCLEELLHVVNLARVPCTPAFVAGVVNHRGELLTILDLKHFFRMPALAISDEARIIVVKHAGIRIGLLVDSVDGNEEYHLAELSPPLSCDRVSNYVQGIHAGNVTLLNLTALLEDPALQVNR